jgi:hypothetical protein
MLDLSPNLKEGAGVNKVTLNGFSFIGTTYIKTDLIEIEFQV